MGVTLFIPGTFPDWRVQAFYQGKHWSERSRIANDAHEQVWGAVMAKLGVGIDPFAVPVVVTVTQFCIRPPDVDNSPVKVVLDGLRHAGLLKDDTPEYVSEVRLRSRKVRREEDERIEIRIEEAA